MHDHMYQFFDQIFLKLQYGFGKGFNSVFNKYDWKTSRNILIQVAMGVPFLQTTRRLLIVVIINC